MGNAWFETVAEARRRAKRHLPKSVHMALVAGSEAGLTLADNVAAFGELRFAPHVAGLAANGQAGVENVLDVLRMGIDSVLLGLGHSNIAELRPEDLLIPAGFTRTLGAPDTDPVTH